MHVSNNTLERPHDDKSAKMALVPHSYALQSIHIAQCIGGNLPKGALAEQPCQQMSKWATVPGATRCQQMNEFDFKQDFLPTTPKHLKHQLSISVNNTLYNVIHNIHACYENQLDVAGIRSWLFFLCFIICMNSNLRIVEQFIECVWAVLLALTAPWSWKSCREICFALKQGCSLVFSCF